MGKLLRIWFFCPIQNSLTGDLVWNGKKVTSQLFGNYNSLNVALAIAYGNIFKVEDKLIIKAIKEYKPNSSRSKMIKTPHNELISDAYNANPSSVELVIDAFKSYEKDNKWLILGDMKEMGVEKEVEHQNILEKLNKIVHTFEKVILIGEAYYIFRDEYPKMNFFLEVEELISLIKKNPLKDKSILLKGSRSVLLEKIEAYC